MVKESLKDMELEHELEALYQEVANGKNALTSIKEPKVSAAVSPPSQAGEPSSIEPKKRDPRFLFIAASAIVSFLMLVFATLFFWPAIRQHYTTNFGGKHYSQRVNKTAGKSVVVPPVEDVKPTVKTEVVSIISSSEKSNGKKYSIQVRAYPEAEKTAAAEFLSSLKKIYPEVHLERADVRGRIWYRILIGHYANSEEASAYMKQKKVLEAYPGSFIQVTSGGQS